MGSTIAFIIMCCAHQLGVSYRAHKSYNGEHEVVICRGVGDMNESQFKELGGVWKRYADDGVITATSSLLYRISPDGKFEPYHTNFETWTRDYLTPKGVKALPHVFCDSTCCKTCDLPGSLEAAMGKRNEFFQSSIDAAKKFGWHGYALDFEGSMPDIEKVNKFFEQWRKALANAKLELHLWSNSGADEKKLSETMTSVIDMHAYDENQFSSSSSFLQSSSPSVLSRTFRARELVQLDGRSSICPMSALSSQAHSASSMLAVAADEKARRASATYMKDEIDNWCADKAIGTCALGLITYDLPNRELTCADMVRIADHSMSKGVRGLWIWSGGIIPKQWEAGLRRYTSKGEVNVACDDKKLALAATPSAVANTPKSDKDCGFDGNFHCNGELRPKKQPDLVF
eukprot:TRINITY_DN27816_c0_g2_i1.p1 TRINITY_DN27816_c0_g2~~TRINITY_DN27816_c0_g2_i1.p1  ORF type:complete len:401 (-),score=64.58 TRINITY_DN27816_c0_g2_i1:117-1319(-)